MLAQGPLVNKLTTLPDLIGNAGVLGDEECHFMQEMQSGSWYAYTMSELVPCTSCERVSRSYVPFGTVL